MPDYHFLCIPILQLRQGTISYGLTEFEHAAIWRIGWERISLNIKFGSCVLYKFREADPELPYSQFNYGVSLNFNL